MKNTVLIATIVISLSILTSCAKKDNIQANLTVFSNNTFSAKSVLATAD
ncbi:hypothetical protein [Mucilaginibacter sp. UR6-11]|nr:hypothetical protein [Mucilaginibacter sp. UR6-11]MCC8426639.1 hypothetical protein [Mucilaginibacter sp. UR6-11]